MIKLSYIKSDNRQYNIERCLSLIKTEITKGLKNAKSVVIKPDCIVADNQLAATHVDAIESVLFFIRPFVKGQITLAEGASIGNTVDAFKNYDYYKLQDAYDLAIVDLNTDDHKFVDLVDKNGEPWQARVSETLLNSDYIISICPPKAHQKICYTGGLNNIALGSLHRGEMKKGIFNLSRDQNDKNIAFQATTQSFHNIEKLISKFQIKLSVIDGYEIMQGDGPINGELVPGHFCIAGIEPLSADVLACATLGMDPSQIEYLQMLGDTNPDNYFVIGDDWQKNILEIKSSQNMIDTP